MTVLSGAQLTTMILELRVSSWPKGAQCQSSVVCHVSLPHVSLFGLFPVLV